MQLGVMRQTIPEGPTRFTRQLPVDCKIVRVAWSAKHLEPSFWYIMSSTLTKNRHFIAVGTGRRVDTLPEHRHEYVGSYETPAAEVWHILEEVRING